MLKTLLLSALISTSQSSQMVDQPETQCRWSQNVYHHYLGELRTYQEFKEKDFFTRLIPKINEIIERDHEAIELVYGVYARLYTQAHKRDSIHATFENMYMSVDTFRHELSMEILYTYNHNLFYDVYQLDIPRNYIWADGAVHHHTYISRDNSPVGFQMDRKPN